MLEVGQRTNEELIQMHRDGVEFAADVLWEQNLGVTHKWINKTQGNSQFSYDELLSFAHIAFVNSLEYFKHEKGFKFITLYGKAYNQRLSLEIENSHRAAKWGKRFVSLDKGRDNDEGLDIIDWYGYTPDLTFAETNKQLLKEAVEYGLSLLKEDYREYVLDTVFGTKPYSGAVVAEILKETKGLDVKGVTINSHYKRFKDNVKDYLVYHENKEIVKTNKLTKRKSSLIKVG